MTRSRAVFSGGFYSGCIQTTAAIYRGRLYRFWRIASMPRQIKTAIIVLITRMPGVF